eukprot:CAMPEP_0184647378 /NCGR_PEP_ID=MMETSP0308-20130426/4287_1 /TAXON_ID=38269 /ORGANISM="Gloeochaete witrockiana, Strain SAG 46.84" /LENGTH=117 /DNA_ID=CAMNT_0027078271 /DNA_START=1235 /DNA_END=1588 /DNA_ORIENTATION=-
MHMSLEGIAGEQCEVLAQLKLADNLELALFNINLASKLLGDTEQNLLFTDGVCADENKGLWIERLCTNGIDDGVNDHTLWWKTVLWVAICGVQVQHVNLPPKQSVVALHFHAVPEVT